MVRPVNDPQVHYAGSRANIELNAANREPAPIRRVAPGL
jgi:hypothetical protein